MAATRPWTLVTSHCLVLAYVATHPNATIRATSDELGITERQVLRILGDLDRAKLVHIKRAPGRRNSYSLNRRARFRHPSLRHAKISEVVDTLARLIETA